MILQSRTSVSIACTKDDSSRQCDACTPLFRVRITKFPDVLMCEICHVHSYLNKFIVFCETFRKNIQAPLSVLFGVEYLKNVVQQTCIAALYKYCMKWLTMRSIGTFFVAHLLL